MNARRGSWPWVLLLAVLGLGGGLATGAAILVHVAYLLIALLILCPLYAWLSLRSLRLEHRASAARIVAGDRLLEIYQLKSAVPWPILGIMVRSRPGVSGVPQHWALATGRRGGEEWTAVSVAPMRGRYSVGVSALTVSDPFGLSVFRRALPISMEVVVHPRPRIIPDFVLAVARAGDLMSARRSWAHMPVSGAVRPFAAGDASTRIHWLSSARHGMLMVKDSERSVGQRVWVALDLNSALHAGSGEQSTVEYAVEAAAYVVELAFKAGLNVGLIVSGPRTLVAQPARGRDQREYLMDLLAVARQGEGLGLATAIEDSRATRPSDAIILLTPEVSDELIELAARLRRLGCGVAAVLLDAPSFGGALPQGGAALEAERVPVYVLSRVGT
jgi:uncharacterized protein (DUF58 family)